MTPRHPRKLLALTLGAGIVALAACAPSSSTGSAGDDGDGTTLTVWSWRVEDKAAYDKVFDAYEAENEGVTVDFKPFKATEYNKILATGFDPAETFGGVGLVRGDAVESPAGTGR